MKYVLIAATTFALGLWGGWALRQGGVKPKPAAVTASAGNESSAKPKVVYTCGMHPQVRQDHPGNCPICGMKLVPVKVQAEAGSTSAGQKAKGKRKVLYWQAPMDPTYIRDKPGKSPMGMDLVPVYADQVSSGPTVTIDPVTQQNMGIRTAPVIRGPLVHEVRTVGNVQYDETKIGVVTLKVGGYIEKLYVDATGEHVKKGEPLFTMYSPQVVQAQDEYLKTRANYESSTGEDKVRWKDLLYQSRQKLLRWDITPDQITALEKRGHSDKVMTWVSPFNGVVVHKNALEGSYFKPGQPLYKIVDLSRVWVYVSVYEYDFPWLKEGETAHMKLPYFPGETFTGKVDYIYPYLDAKTRDRKVRLSFPNPKLELVPDMYSTVTIESKLSDSAVLVPRDAVIDTGERQVAFIAKPHGKFDPRNVKIGVQSRGGYLQVLSGLVPGDNVVTSGQFLIDSESNLQEAIQQMRERHKQGEGTTSHAGKKMRMKGMAGKGTMSSAAGVAKAGAKDRSAAPQARFTAPPGIIPVVPKTCPVRGGKPVPTAYADYRGHRFFFCCGMCRAPFLKNPKKYIAKIRAEGVKVVFKN